MPTVDVKGRPKSVRVPTHALTTGQVVWAIFLNIFLTPLVGVPYLFSCLHRNAILRHQEEVRQDVYRTFHPQRSSDRR